MKFNLVYETKQVTDIIVKKVETEEEERLVADQTFYAFSPSPGSQENQLKRREYFKSAREFIVLENKKPMSTSNYVPMTQNIRGKIFDMGGVAGVASYPEARRKGFVKLLMKKMFDEMRAEKRAISILYPFRESFYSKFGYITVDQELTGSFSPTNLVKLVSLDLDISAERVKFEDGLDDLYEFHKVVQKRYHGFSLYEKLWMKSGETNPSWITFIKKKEEIIGAMTYKISGFAGTMKVGDFLFTNSVGKYSLLHWIARHTDHVTKVEMNLNPSFKLETWIDDLQLEKKNRDWVPSHMFRVISVEDLNGISVGIGAIEIEIIDQHCPWNNGSWKFVSENGKLNITKLNHKVDDQLTINGFSALIYGIYELDDFEIKGWGNLSKLTKLQLESIFPVKLPFVSKFV